MSKAAVKPARQSELRVRLADVCSIESALVDPREASYRDLLHVGGANITAGIGELHDLRSAADEKLISGKYLFGTADVLYSKIRPYLRKVALPTFPGLCSADIYPLRVDPTRLEREYLYYLLLSDHFTAYANRVSNRAGMPKVNREQLFDFTFLLPELDAQRVAVETIRQMMARLDEVRRLRNESRREADAVEAALVGDLLANLPKDVPVVPLGAVLTQSQYGTSKKASLQSRGVPIYRMSNIQRGRLIHDDLKFVELPAADVKKYALGPGDILINRTNSLELVGKAACVEDSNTTGVFASYLVRLSVDRTRADPGYVSFVINSRIGRDYVLRTARRAIGMVNINSREIARMPLPIPSLELQQRMVATFREVRRTCDALREETHDKTIDALPSAVYRQALAGEP